MKTVNKIIMTLAGLLLIIASLLKVHQMLTEPIISKGFWESWTFFLITIPLEFGLGVWLVSGLFRKAAALAGAVAYGFFIGVTLYKAVTGQSSCGCFGTVHVNPWITLSAVDLPCFILLVIFRPTGQKLLPPPWPHPFHCLLVAIPACLIIGAMVPTMYFNKVPYKIVDPANWTAEPPKNNNTQPDQNDVTIEPVKTNHTDANDIAAVNSPDIVIPDKIQKNEENAPQWKQMINNTDIAEELNTDVKIVMFYHYDCPNCAKAIPLYDQYSRQLAADKTIQFAFVKGPPYGPDEKDPVPADTTALVGKLFDENNELIFESPLTILLSDGRLIKAWSVEYPNLDQLLSVILSIE